MEEPESKEYFQKRAKEEEAAAEQAEDERAEQLHRELARRYADKAKGKSNNLAEPPESPSILPREFRILP